MSAMRDLVAGQVYGPDEGGKVNPIAALFSQVGWQVLSNISTFTVMPM